MTGQELQQLAREYAKEKGYSTFSEEVIETPALDFLQWLTKTHCIVSRETILSQHSQYMRRMKEVSSARQTNRAKAIALEAAFGKSTFEKRTDK